MTEFHEIRFPLTIAYGSTGGPERRTSVVELVSGYEERNAQWSDSRRRYDAGYGVRSLDDLHRIISFFEARNGRLHGFRFRDLLDWKSCLPSMQIASTDQTIGTGDGQRTKFQLSKTYSSGTSTWKRNITKHVAGSILLEISGTKKNINTDWNINATGEITFATAPLNQAVIKAGFEFDIPVRFDTDYLAIDLAAFQAGEIPEIPLVEIKI
jgi:uncharacterized protein (TIGR02217 family)